VADDVIPFGFARGQHATLDGLNFVGLRGRGVSREELHQLRRAFRSLFLGDGELAIGLRGWRAHLPTIRWCKRSSRSSERGVNGRSCIRDEGDDPDGLPGSLRFSATRTANYFLYRPLTTVSPSLHHTRMFSLRRHIETERRALTEPKRMFFEKRRSHQRIPKHQLRCDLHFEDCHPLGNKSV